MDPHPNKRFQKVVALKPTEDRTRAKAKKTRGKEGCKQRTPVERMSEMVLMIGEVLHQHLKGDSSYTKFEEHGVECVDDPEARIPAGLRWRRNCEAAYLRGGYDGAPAAAADTDRTLAHQVVCHMAASRFIDLIASQTVEEEMNKIKSQCSSNDRLTIVIEGLEKFFKKQETKANAEYRAHVINRERPSMPRRKKADNSPVISRMQAERELVNLQVRKRLISFWSCECVFGDHGCLWGGGSEGTYVVKVALMRAKRPWWVSIDLMLALSQ